MKINPNNQPVTSFATVSAYKKQYRWVMIFHDRTAAGKQLAKVLSRYKDRSDAIVLALPRGGVPVAFEVARALRLPLDLMLVRKLGVPSHKELAMGAIAAGNIRVLNEDIIHEFGINNSVIADTISEEIKELERRNQAYRQDRPIPKLEAHLVILVDDGCATGANMKAAVQSAIRQNAARVVVAVPVISDSAYEALREIADEVICLDIPEKFFGVGNVYHDFSQTSDAEVKELLTRAWQQ